MPLDSNNHQTQDFFLYAFLVWPLFPLMCLESYENLKYIRCFKFHLKIKSNKHIITLFKALHTFLCLVVTFLVFLNPFPFHHPTGISTPLMDSLEGAYTYVSFLYEPYIGPSQSSYVGQIS
jgi:hypothetical protein